jgi:hypothetical protein
MGVAAVDDHVARREQRDQLLDELVDRRPALTMSITLRGGPARRPTLPASGSRRSFCLWPGRREVVDLAGGAVEDGHARNRGSRCSGPGSRPSRPGRSVRCRRCRRCVWQRRAWGWSPGVPARALFRGDGRISKFLGTPIPVCPCSSTPAGQCVPDHLQDTRLAPVTGTTKAPTTSDFRGSIAWLSGSPPTYHDVGYPSPRKAGFQVLVRLSWTGFHPQGSCKRFSTHFMCVGLLFQASWHNPTLSSQGANGFGRKRLCLLLSTSASTSRNRRMPSSMILCSRAL